MKTPLLQLLIPATIALATSLCSAQPAGGMTAEFLPVTTPEAGDIPTIGDRAINSIGYSLVMEVSNVLAKEGAKAAIEKCHLKDVPATGEVLQGVPRVVAYKRTSLRLRDPANAPDAAEQMALLHVQKELEAGKPAPKIMLQRVTHADGKKEWRVYRPVAVTARCVACHGPTDGIAADVMEELKARYPADDAVGLAKNSWRGLIRVTVAPE